MIRTVLTPDNTTIHISIPQTYVGKKLEILMYDIDEITTSAAMENEKRMSPSELRGFLSAGSAEALHQHTQNSRNEWDTL